ncbi:hypothetical protein AXK61_14655 [Tsukamurella pseudospumae]|uniref:Pyridoxamine 5'-phosphate oxidase n=1 Tax=Tsukamurella pseudospumae TaxID=239498 RepID=A0A137ZR63_9ACTN|nr:hypothetical protein AXK61_14655 [Tsukamurella pseudospumae]
MLPAYEAWKHLRGTTIGRIVTTAPDGTVDVFPVSYTVHDGEILIPTRLGTKLRDLATHPETVFEADGSDPTAQCVWSVVVRARARIHPNPAELRHAEKVHLEPLVDLSANQLVVLVPTSVSGREYRTR